MSGRGNPDTLGDETSERRVVTILFIDVVGSTAMAETLDPEEWAELMSEAFDIMIRPIERYGGTVTRLLGDAVLALFGAPYSHGDDPRRAILAALEIMDAIQPLRERIRRLHGLEFNARAGINTGLVVVGQFGSDELVEYTAMGDPINVAARLEALAAPGTVLIGESTYRLTAPYFEFEPLGRTDVRGKRAPELSYRPLRYRDGAAGLDGAARRMPLVGRDSELGRIIAAVDELRYTGKGRIITIIGEAGVGKSRLVDEVITYVRSCPTDSDSLPIALLENRVNPYDGTRPYAGLQARFRKVFGIEVNDSSEVVRRKFIARTSQFPAEFRERGAQVIQRVMALNIDGLRADDSGLEPEEFKAELTAVILQVVRGWNPDGAFMLVGEDYHWGDHASLEVLSHLYTLLDDRPVLYLCTFRPDPDAPVMRIFEGVKARYADFLLQIDLEPLPTQATSALLEQLIEGDTPEAVGLRQVIQERADGNPLFIEELVRALSDQGALEPIDGEVPRWRPASNATQLDLSLPNSIQALLLERIDRLPPAARRTLQQAAVLGRTFNRRVLREVVQVDGNLADHISTLLRLEMIQVLDDGEGGENFVFRHALIQEAAYNTILLRHRRHFHRRAAEALDRFSAGRASEYASDIGLHYYRAGDARGVEWLLRAAEHAQAVYEPELVIDYASKALELGARDETPPPARALLLRGRARDMTGDFEGARTDVETVVSQAREVKDLELEWEALLELGAIWSIADYDQAGAQVRNALAVAHLIGDEARVAHSLNRIGNWYVNVGDPASARKAHAEAHTIFERLDDRLGRAETVDLLGLAHYLSSNFEAGAVAFEQAVATFREVGNNRGLASSLAMLALSGSEVDAESAPRAPIPPEAALAHAREALDIARSISWRSGEAFALIALGELEFGFGNPGKGIECIQAALDVARAIRHKQWTIAAIQALGGLTIDLYNFERTCGYLEEALERARELGSAYWTTFAVARLIDWHIEHGELERASELLAAHIDLESPLDYIGQRKLWFRRARLALAGQDPDLALATVERLYATAPGLPPGGTLARLSTLRGEALLQRGLLREAIEELEAAAHEAWRTRNWRSEMCARARLARALESAGDTDRAAGERRAAAAIVDRMAGQLPEGEWRASFLARADRMLAPEAAATARENG